VTSLSEEDATARDFYSYCDVGSEDRELTVKRIVAYTASRTEMSRLCQSTFDLHRGSLLRDLDSYERSSH
jgi:hypothetical protein